MDTSLNSTVHRTLQLALQKQRTFQLHYKNKEYWGL